MPIKERDKSKISTSLNQWDKVANYFDPNIKNNSNYFPAKENFEAIWPYLSKLLCQQKLPNRNDFRICDFGCGTGVLAEKLSTMLYDIYACDTSQEMIALAQSSTKGLVTYKTSFEHLKKHGPFNLITAIMVFQFISNPQATINAMAENLIDGGHIFFATHNVDYVYECINNGIKFYKTDCTNLTEYKIAIGCESINTFVRDPKWYDDIMKNAGFSYVSHSVVPALPPPNLECKDFMNSTKPKYYIAWYKKTK